MGRFIHYDYRQMTMVVINYLEQIHPGTFEFALHYLISEKLYLSAFHQPYKNDAEGRPAYDPAILLKIILFAYSKGITSRSRVTMVSLRWIKNTRLSLTLACRSQCLKRSETQN